jgi:inner membrane protein
VIYLNSINTSIFACTKNEENFMNDNAAQPASIPGRKRFSTILQMGFITLLVLLLLIPLSMVNSVLQERLARRDDAVHEITSTWGSEQVVMGPVLVIPYKYEEKVWNKEIVAGQWQQVERIETIKGNAYFLPAVLTADGQLSPDRLHRGIYETVVYSGKLNLKGNFSPPSFEELNIAPQQVLWNEAEIAISITDLRGAKETLQIKVADQVIPLKPGKRLAGFEGGVHARIPGLNGEAAKIPFEMSLTINGNRSLRFAPVGVNNDIQLKSSWPDPSFQGAFLPNDRKVSSDGFSAHWQVPYYGRSYPQQWTDKSKVDAAGMASSLFGVDLVPLLDSYRYVERAIKYGILFIVLLFITFFLFEILSALRIHPFQYTLIGITLCLFYLGLLALSEVTSFTAAYWISAAVTSLLIALYSVKALHSPGRGGIIAAGLVSVYAFLFVILRLQDYSLLVGTIGLFLVLAIVMFVTRNLDWYVRDSGK